MTKDKHTSQPSEKADDRHTTLVNYLQQHTYLLKYDFKNIFINALFQRQCSHTQNQNCYC